MTPKEWRHIHGSGGLRFDLDDVRESYAVCVELEHLPELQTTKKRCEKILDELDGKNYESLYNSACSSVTLRDTEIDRLQRVIYDRFSHDEAVAIIGAAPLPLQRAVIRDTEMNKLKQDLDAARVVRDKLIDQKKSEFVVDWAYRIVSAQGSVDQAKKALYIKMRKTSKSRLDQQETKHRDL